MNTEANCYLAALGKVPGVGRGYLRRLITVFGDGAKIWQSTAEEIVQKAELPQKTAEAVAEFCRTNLDEPEKLRNYCDERGYKIFSLVDAEYPPLLKEIFDPPACFFIRGNLPPGDGIAIVGSRRSTPYGLRVAESMGKDLAAAGLTVISGAARGIDTAAHKGALAAGKTVAVLGCGLDIPYPPENRQLLDKIAEQGAVISEYLPGTTPHPGNFPSRNRIISGLSRGTLVVEAPIKSGALITAELALSSGRDVFAVPAGIYASSSMGCLRLIQHGAKLVVSADDILTEYGVKKRPTRPKAGVNIPLDLTEEELAVYKTLDTEQPLSIDEIIFKTNKNDASHITVILLQLEMRGHVKRTDAHGYVRVERT